MCFQIYNFSAEKQAGFRLKVMLQRAMISNFTIKFLFKSHAAMLKELIILCNRTTFLTIFPYLVKN